MAVDLIGQEGINWILVAALLFAWPLTKWICTLFYELFKQALPATDILKKYCKPDGQSWAVVTGATDGIGLGFCEILVKYGFNVVLISRSSEKLKSTIERLSTLSQNAKKKVSLKAITFDFKDSSDPQKYGQLIGQLKLLDIGLFINNVGTSEVTYFHNFSHDKIVDFINVNCIGMAALSADIVNIFRGRQHKSALINVSSYMEEKALPLVSLYAATKAFNKSLTEGIWHENPDIDVMCLKPMFVETPLSRQKKGFAIPDRMECASDSLRELSWEHETYGHISHRIIGPIPKFLIPDWLYRLVARRLAKVVLKKSYPGTKID